VSRGVQRIRRGDFTATVSDTRWSKLWRVKPVDIILRQSDQQEHGLKRTLGAVSITAMGIGAICGLTTMLIILLYGQSRIFFSMARDGLLPGLFSRIHVRFRTPYFSSIIVGAFVATLAGLTPIDVVAELTNIGSLSAFVLVSLGVLILRRTQPNLRRAFRVPLVPLIPILSMIGSLFLIVNLPLITIGRFIVWLAIGLVVYFAYSQRRSHL
jgi:basic amino acid/polyamine antiporter, APA family